MSRLNVIVAVKNMADSGLNACLESLINQTYKDMMVLVVDDCSADNTSKIVKEYETKYPERIKAYSLEETFGIGGARNKGLIEADSEWIAFVNGIDVVDPEFYEKLMDEADKNNADVVGCVTEFTRDNQVVDTEDWNPVELEVPVEEMKAFLFINPGTLESKIYKREIFDKNGLWFPTSLEYEHMGVVRLALYYADNYVYTNTVKYVSSLDGKEETEDMLYDRVDVMTYFIEETYKREIISEYPEEIEEVYLEEMYINTLLSYMEIVPGNKWKLSFLNYLREGIMECFPEFDTNPYYWEKYEDEVKDMLELHCSSPKKFINTYKTIWRGNR